MSWVTRLPLLIASLVFAAVTLAFALLLVTNESNRAKQWVVHTTQVELETQKLLSALLNAETGQRGFILTGNDRYLGPYQIGIRDAPVVFKRLQALTVDNPDEQIRLEEIGELMTARLNLLAIGIDLQQKGETAQVSDAFKRGEGNRLMEGIRAKLATVMQDESKLLAERNGWSARASTLGWRLSGALATLVAALGFVIYRHLDAEVDRLEQAVSDRTADLGVVTSELAHRAQNQLALVQSIANQTGRFSTEVPDFLAKFGARLQALSRSISELARRDWRGADLATLARSELNWLPPTVSRDRIFISGTDITLAAMPSHYLGLAIHELATNALKYGALSNEAGRVKIVWTVAKGDTDIDEFSFIWRESGGPPIQTAPTRSGFGSTILTRLTASAMSGAATSEYASDGLEWTLRAPLSNVCTPVVNRVSVSTEPVVIEPPSVVEAQSTAA